MWPLDTMATCNWWHEDLAGVAPHCNREGTRSDGRCDLHSSDAGKDPEPIRNALEEGLGHGRLSCAGWVFPFRVEIQGRGLEDVDCLAARFLAGASFENCNFAGSKPARFDWTRFDEEATFAGSRFNLGVLFAEARFNAASFRLAEFRGATRFIRTQFATVGVFSGSAFATAPTFQDVRFGLNSRFQDVQFQTRTTFDGVDFQDGEFDNTDVSPLTFRSCKMEGVQLAKAYNVADADFVGGSWGTRWEFLPWGRIVARLAPDIPLSGFRKRVRLWLWRLLPTMRTTRYVVCEEREARKRRNLDLLYDAQRVCREVRRSLEEHKHFREAAQFDLREMELRELSFAAAYRWRRVLNLDWWIHSAYNVFSHYGYSVSRPLFWLVLVVVVIVPLIVGWQGSTRDAEPIRLSLISAALLPLPASARLFYADVALVLERIIAPLFALLLTLSIRRRFRR